MKNIQRRFLKDTLHGFLVILGAILLALSLRIFFFASFKIPSPSMVPAIEAGDYIFVNKLIPGPRVYENFDFRDGKKVETRRFKGIRAIRRNEVLVFNFPYMSDWSKIKMDLSVNYVKRCIAIPGDTFYIDNGIYKVKGCSDALGHLAYQQGLSRKEKEQLPPGTYDCFPYDTVHYHWNIQHFGPLFIPGTGDTVVLDSINYRLYKNLIEYETDSTISIRKGAVYLGEKKLENYVFKQNYYFMSGDWVFDSRDSRYWGLLPEDHIIGKAAFVWQSKNMQTGKYNWKRFFKAVK